jgi:anti-sigma B factor antagonist
VFAALATRAQTAGTTLFAETCLMEISVIQYKHSDLVKAKGRVDSYTAPQLADAFNKITDTGRFKIAFDMSELDFLSSAGLRVLINTQKTCKRYNRGELVLVNIPENIYAALDLAGFIPLFKIYDDVLTAVGSL